MPELLQILHAPVGLHHIGIGVDALLAPLRHHLGVAHQMGQRPAFLVENAKPVIGPVGNIDVAIGIDRDTRGVIEDARRGTFRVRHAREERTEVGDGKCVRCHRDLSILADRHEELAAR